jgi:hypothetical protein
MGLVIATHPFGDGRLRHEEVPVVNFHRVARHGIDLIARLTESGADGRVRELCLRELRDETEIVPRGCLRHAHP